MRQQTSIDAYVEGLLSGAIGAAQSRALSWARAATVNGPATGAEILKGHVDNVNLGRARLTELADIGAIVEAGRRPCRVTGRQAITWVVAEYPWTPRVTNKPADILADVMRMLMDVPAEYSAAIVEHVESRGFKAKVRQ